MVNSQVDYLRFQNVRVQDCRVLGRFDRGFNHIVKMSATGDDYTSNFVFRVPAVGTAARWQAGDAHNMRCEVALMKYLCEHIKITVPEIIAWNYTLNSVIGAPYIFVGRLDA